MNRPFCLLLALLSFFPALALEKDGVLILAHGGSPLWESTVTEAVLPLRAKYPLEIAYGMADPVTIQEGINRLEAQGVNRIVVVQLFVSSFSQIIRQNEYVLGFRKELADEPLIMDHRTGGTKQVHSSHSHQASSAVADFSSKNTIDPVVTKSKILMVRPLDADSLVAGILFDRVSEFSKSASRETVILVAHGPDKDEDNIMWMACLDTLSEILQKMRKKAGLEPMKKVIGATVRDDANKKIYTEARRQLRHLVEENGKEGEVLVIPVVLSTGGIEKGIQKRLEGLEYIWVNKALLPHSNITMLVERKVKEALQKGK